MTMVVATQRQPQPESGYTSFPNASPSRSYESAHSSKHQQQPPPSPWYSCNPDDSRDFDKGFEPETDHPPSPEGAAHRYHKRTMYREDQRQVQMSPGGLKFRLNPQQQRQQQEQQRQQQHRQSGRQQQQPPNYPNTIMFSPSHDEFVPFDELTFDDEPQLGLNGLSLNEASLDDTFGFVRHDKDDLFEKLYTGTETEEDTLQSGSIELNPYPSREDARAAAAVNSRQKQQINQNKNSLNQNKNSLNRHVQGNKPCVHLTSTDNHQQRNRNGMDRQAEAVQPTQQQQARESIFRPSQRNNNNQPSPRTTTVPTTTSYEKKMTEANMKLLSPTEAMDRRRSNSRPRSSRSEVATPSPSCFASNSSSIQRSNTASSLRRNNTGASTKSRSRHRSASRSNRSRSRGTSRGTSKTSRSRRSRSRSTSIAPSKLKKDDDYHQSLFRGAAMIREQLLRSMASADQAMDEAEREFMEEMIERGAKGSPSQQQQAARQANRQNKNGGEGIEAIDFDYSFDHSSKKPDVAQMIDPTPSRGSGVRFSPKGQDSSALMSESRRLDNLMSIFAANSTSTTSNSNVGGVEFNRTSSDKDNDAAKATPQNQPNLTCQANRPTSQAIDVYDLVSPVSSLGLNSPTSVSPTSVAHLGHMNQNQNAKVHNNEYASRYFQQDAPKPIVTSPTIESKPSNVQTTVPQNEAFVHAQRAGPFWRSLVGNHVRFPSQWDSQLPSTTPPIHHHNRKWSKWYYVARHRVKGDKRLNSRESGVRSRRSGGRILMRLVVREMHTQQVCREVAIGCYHPNSKGIRKGDPTPENEDVREVWMSVRWLMDDVEDEPVPDLRKEGHNYEGVVDGFLIQKKKSLDYSSMGSALGHKKAVNNENVRAIFGDQQPMTTVDLHEDEVAEIIKANGSKKLAVLPALMLLKLFLFSK